MQISGTPNPNRGSGRLFSSANKNNTRIELAQPLKTLLPVLARQTGRQRESSKLEGESRRGVFLNSAIRRCDAKNELILRQLQIVKVSPGKVEGII